VTALLLRLALAIAFALAIGIVALSKTSINQASALGNSPTCYHRLLYNPPRNTEIVAIGSSRIRRGVTPEIIANAFGLEDDQVLNLGHPSISPAYDAGVIERIAAMRPLRMVVFEVTLRSPALRAAERSIDPRRNAIYDIGLSSGIYEELYVIGGEFPEQMARLERHATTSVLGAWDVSRVFADRIAKTLGLLSAGRQLTIMLGREEAGLVRDRQNMCFLANWDDPSEASQHGNPAARALKVAYRDTFAPPPDGSGWHDPEPFGFFDAPEFASRRAAMHDLVAMGIEEDFIPVFLYLPGIYTPQPTAAVLNRFDSVFGAPLLVPPQDLRARLERDGYYDNSHLNTDGRAAFSDWLAQALLRIEAETQGS
jgi:hypothetical protein